jgi:predicted transcriptional regulator
LLRLSILEYKIDKPRQTDLLGLTSNTLPAHVYNNPTTTSELTQLIQDVYITLTGVGIDPSLITKQ